jgi:hypothetical protein
MGRDGRDTTEGMPLIINYYTCLYSSLQGLFKNELVLRCLGEHLHQVTDPDADENSTALARSLTDHPIAGFALCCMAVQ